MSDFDLDIYEEEGRCPYCGEYMSYCQGHGEIGDPDGFIALQKHDDDNHEDCHPNGCEVLRDREWAHDYALKTNIALGINGWEV